jgi:hypothetical protein
VSLRSALQLGFLFALGLLVGAWVFISPWVLGYPAGRRGAWSPSMLSQAVVGAVVAVASATALVVVIGRTLHMALPSRAQGTPPPEQR